MPTDPTRTDLGPSGDGAAPRGAVPASGTGASDAAASGAGAARGRRSRRKQVGNGLLVGLGALATVVVGALVFLQTTPGQTWARGLVVGQIANVFADDAEISAEGLEGNFLTGARLRGLTVARDGETILAVDTVLVDYNLTTLLRRTFSASELAIRGPRLTIRQRADSTFNLAGLLKPADEEEQKDPFAVVLDRLVVTNGAADVIWYRPDGPDSVHAVRDVSALVRDFRSRGDSLSGDIEGLALRAIAPFERATAQLAAAGRFSKQELDLRELSIASTSGTDVTGHARLAFMTDGSLPVFDAVLEATPIALEDARAFAGVTLYGDPRMRLRVDSDGDLLTTSLAGALGDATISLDGEFSRETDGPVRYRAQGTLQRFDPSELTGNPAQAAEVTGDLRLNLQGTTLATLSGPFNVALRETRVGGRTIDRLDVDGSFAAGRVTFDIDGALPGATIVAEGRARPFDEVPTIQVAGTAQDVDLGVLLPGSGRTDAFAGEFALVGRGASLDTFSGNLALDLTRADIGLRDRRLRFTAVDLDADIDRGVVAFDTDATLADGAGRIVALGTLQLGDPLAYEVVEGEAYGLNLTALTGKETQDSDLTGSFTLSGQGLDLTQAPIDLTANLTDSRYGTYEVAASDLDVILRNGTAQIDAALDFGPGGQLTATGTAQPFALPLSYRLEGTMQNLDLAEVQGIPERYSDLTGAYSVNGSGIDPTTAVLSAQVRITEPSSYGERFVDGADLAVTLDNGFLTVDGDLVTPEGAFDLAFSGRPFDANPGYEFEHACFSDLDVSRFAEAAPRSDLNGCFSGRISGVAEIASADGQGVVTLRPSRINDAEIDDGRIAFTLRDGALDADLDLALASPAADEGVAEGGRVVATFVGRPFDEVPSYAVEGRTVGLDAGTLLDLPPDNPLRVTLAFDVTGRGFDPATMTLAGALDGGPSTLGPIGLDTLQTRFALDGGVVRFDTLRVESDLATVRGAGTLALFNDTAPSAFHLEGAIASLAPLASMTERTIGLETGTLVLDVAAEAGGPLRIVGAAEARQIIVDDYALTGLDATLNAAYDRSLPDSVAAFDRFDGALRAQFAVLNGPTFRVEQGQAVVGMDDGTYTVEAGVRVDDRRDLDLFARFDPTAEGVLLERGRFKLDRNEWSLLQPAEISLADGVIDVRGLILASDDGARQIAADGTLDFEGQQNFVLTVESLPIDALTDFVALDALGGELSATLDLTGSATAPRIDGVVTLDDLTSRGQPVGALAAEVAYADNRLRVDAVLTHVDGETLTVDGTVPFQFSLASAIGEAPLPDERVALRARAQAFPIDWARPFLDDRVYNALGGTLRLDLSIAGTQASPRLDGVATLQNGRLGVVKTGRIYEPIVADLTFQNDRIVLDDVRILDETGRTALDITGDIRLRELSVGEFDLTITPREFLAMDSRTYRGLTINRGPQPLRLTGTLDKPVLRGSVVLSEGDIYLTDELVPPELEPVTLTDAQIREVEARFGRVVTARDTSQSRFVDALDYSLTVEIEQNVWLRSNAGLTFDIEFSGDVEARKRSYAEGSQLFGRIDLGRGTVETLNRQFQLEDGSILFNGDPLAARVDLAATLDIRLPGSVAGQSSATITLSAEGRLDDNPTIRLSANPAMEAADIVSLIATGRLADDFVGTGALAGAGTGFLLGQASGVFEGLASEKLGLEMVQIDYEGGDLVLKFGDYLASRLFWTAGVIVPLGDTSQGEQRLPLLLSLDYELLRWLSAQAEYSGQRGVGAGLDYELSW
ncbi:translocation/assembly module TamB domain-containing protein [Rubrivirga sp. IMCC43871]|uniref:translocation/assembly module TamB domain-containing protein n=1 Tax=Rubrivirga sp. IMCC43871 TaxID=3391575 RepID=UPI00398F959A